MYKVLFPVLFSLFVSSASSQRIYFIYLQTESQQPFFVKLGEKIHSSSASGYLILSRLRDSTYNFSIGFTGREAGEQKFTCSINKKDHGYLVRNFGSKGWGLYDLQTSAVLMAAGDGKAGVSVVNGPVNAFTELLSRAADDSTLKQKNVVPEEKVAVNEKPNPETNHRTDSAGTGAVAVPASVVIKQKEDRTETGINKPAQKPATETIRLTPPVLAAARDTVKRVDTALAVEAEKKSEYPPAGEIFVRSKPVRKSESSTTEGFGLVFVDSYSDGTRDTVRLLIPNDTRAPLANKPANEETGIKADTIAGQKALVPLVVPAEKTGFKNSCREIATDADFYRLRKKMAAGKSDGDMLDEAKKIFRAKCFTTSQVKNLGSLFLGDGGKYNFFDAAYPHVADTENFASLQMELKDEYFINRFKAMLR